MRLSEAIRLGAMLHPQYFGAMRKRGARGEVIATCALGAADEAGYGHVFGFLQVMKCPACHEHRAISGNVAHLNDYHGWTRERIAEWVATVEPQEPTAPATEQPASRFLAVDPVEGIVAVVHAR